MGKLVLRLPDGTTREFALDRERVTIGRRADNDICLPFPAVSGEHAAVVTILDDSFLEDLNSTNGTLVNGRTVAKHFLRDNDEIDIGRHTLVYVSGDYAPASHHPLPDGTQTVAVTANGGAMIGDDEATIVPRSRETHTKVTPLPLQLDDATEPEASETPSVPRDVAGESADMGTTIDRRSDAFVELLDGPAAGRPVELSRDEFVIGRPGAGIAALRRADDGFVIVHLEGDERTRVNGAPVGEQGTRLAAGDEIEVASTRMRYGVTL